MLLNAYHYTHEEYFQIERRSSVRHEYVDGEIYAMSGASRRHNLLACNLFGRAWQAAKNKSCQVFGSDMRVRVDARNCYYYPDVSGICDSDDRHELYLTSPCFIIEVLSLSTMNVDRREKRLAYATLPSLRQYVIVDSDRMHITVYPGEGRPWISRVLDQPDDVLELSCLDLRLTVQEIYSGVELPEPGVAEEETPLYRIPLP